MKIEELMKDKTFIVSLLNGPCTPKTAEHDCAPINQAWIDDGFSALATAAFDRLMPEGMPYRYFVLAERNPDVTFGGTCVDDNEKRMRYFVITLIPDSDFPFDCSFPLIHQMRIFSLHCWEIVRATIEACKEDMYVRIAKEPVPPILNNARLEWVSLYLGRKPYMGIDRLSDQWTDPKEYDGTEMDVRLYRVREMEQSEPLRRLIEAYDADYPEGA